jgi:hypothetical protein
VVTNGSYFASYDDEWNILRQTEELRCLPGVGRCEVAFKQSLEESGSLLLGGQCLG